MAKNNFLKNRTSDAKLPTSVLVIMILVFFTSVQSSFFLGINEYVLGGVLEIALILACISNPQVFQLSKLFTKTSILFFLAAMFGMRGNFNGYIGLVILIIPFFMFMLFKGIYKVAFLKALNRVMAITVTISLAAFILHLVGFQIPHYTFEWKSYFFDNFYLFMIIPSDYYALERFQFIFTEPGYFGCLMVFLIFLNKYNFRKWEVGAFFAALIMTYSLAGYFFFFLGLFPFIMSNTKSRLKYLFIFVLLLGGFLYLNSSSSDNFVTEMFAYRLQIKDGRLVGYNRNSDKFGYWFENKYLHNGNFLLGNNDEVERLFRNDKLFGVDLRAYVARYGIIPLMFYFGGMIYYYRNRKSSLGLWYFILFALFYSRGYTVMYYIGFPILFIAGIQMLALKQKKI